MRLNLVGKSVPGEIFGQLRRISTMGHLQAVLGGEMREMKWPQRGRILVCAEKGNFNVMEPNTLLSLFGPVFHLD